MLMICMRFPISVDTCSIGLTIWPINTGRLYTDLEVLQQFGNRGRSPRFPNCCNTDKEVCNRFILRSIVTHVTALFSCDADGISTCCMYCKIAEVSILFGNSLL